jgi:hypothetical protein
VSALRAAAIGVAACLVLAGGGCSSDEPNTSDDAAGGTSTTTPEVTLPDGPPPGATEQGFRSLEVGDCFDLIDELEAADRAVWLFDCSLPHSFEVYDIVEYEGEGAGPGTPYPGAATVQDWAEQACFDRFEAFVGIRWTLSELEIQVWWPSEESWGRTDRSVICAVMSQTGDDLVGTQRGAAI